MEKIDLKKKYKHLYLPSAKKVSVVDVPEFKFVMMDGQIEANTEVNELPEFMQAMEAMYGISYTLKFKSKRREQNPIDYTVMALEGQWWVESGNFDYTHNDPWQFILMMMQPDHITDDMFAEALVELKQKKPNPALDDLRFETWREGLSMQIMHLGPYSEERKTIELMTVLRKKTGTFHTATTTRSISATRAGRNPKTFAPCSGIR